VKIEELKQMIKDAVNEQIAPLQETQRKHADILEKGELPGQQREEEMKEKGEVLEPGIRLARCAKLMILSKNDPEKAMFYAKDAKNPMYPNDKDLHAALKEMTAGDPSDGGYLVPERYAAEIIPLLRAKAVVRKLGARPVEMKGNLNLPKVTGGATAYYVGESQNPTASKLQLGNLRLSSKKLVTLVPLSNDLLRTASSNADQLIRDDMIQTMALKEDHTALYGAGTEYTPLGVKNTSGITKAAKNALPDSDYLASMIGTLMSKNLPWASVGWAIHGALWSVLYNLKDGSGNYIHREEMNQGKLIGLPFEISNQISYGADANKKVDIFLGDWSEFIIGEEMGIEIAASQEAAWFDGTNLQSAFTRDETVLKVTAKHDFGVRHAEAFNVQTDVYTA